MSDKIDDFDFVDLREVLGLDMALAIVEQSYHDTFLALSTIARRDVDKEQKLKLLHIAIGSIGLIGFRRLATKLVVVEEKIRSAPDEVSVEVGSILEKELNEAISEIRKVLMEQNVVFMTVTGW